MDMSEIIDEILIKLEKAWSKYKNISAILMPIFAISYATKPAYAQPQQTPPLDHQTLVNSMKVYYPWKVLEPQFVFLGQENPEGLEQPPVYPESVWLWLWKDKYNIDVACIMVITDRVTFYDVSFAKMDSGSDANKLTVEIRGQKYENIFNMPNVESGFIGFRVTK